MSKLSPQVSEEFKALIEPTTLHLPNGKTVDMRTMSLDEAEMLYQIRPQFLRRLPKKTNDSKSKQPTS